MDKTIDKIILSLDTSTTSTGWALFANGEYRNSGSINLKTIKDSGERLLKMVKEIQIMINTYPPGTTVVIETPVVVRNPQTQRMLTMIFGVVYGECARRDLNFEELRPTQWRKLIDSGKKPRKRDELKEWSKEKVKELFGLDDVNDDISDAILIGQAYVNKRRNYE